LLAGRLLRLLRRGENSQRENQEDGAEKSKRAAEHKLLLRDGKNGDFMGKKK
jgi:hypothetical protein